MTDTNKTEQEPRSGLSDLTVKSEREIKEAFWKTFHKGGELWFDYIGDEDACEASTNEKWSEFIENLRSKVQ